MITFSFSMVIMLKVYRMVLNAKILGSFLKHALFSALTFLLHWEQVYMLSPSSMSITVTSPSDWYKFRISLTWHLRPNTNISKIHKIQKIWF